MAERREFSAKQEGFMVSMDQQVDGNFQFGVAFSADSLDIDEGSFATGDTFSMDGRESSRDTLQASAGVSIELGSSVHWTSAVSA